MSLLLALLALPASAQLISVEELAKSIKDPNIIVVDARPSADYLKTHIDGAINLDASSLSDNSVVEGRLKPVSELAKIIGGAGLSTNKRVVIYCKTGVSAGRLYWVMKYMGFNNISLLDGNMNAWFAARKPITKNPKKLPPVSFTPSVNSSMLVDKSYVKSKLNSSGTIIIDSRKAEDYEAGHIGNAVNIPNDLIVNDSKLRPLSEVAAAFAKIPKDKEVIVYCKTGATGSFTYFVLTSLLKYGNVKLYAGSYMDWTH